MNVRELTKNFELIQKILFLLSLIIIPLSILPLPWDLTEYSMALVTAVFAIPVIFLEVAKMVLQGAVSYRKDKIDMFILGVAGALAVSTVFSQSLNTSLLGFDSRLGTGLAGIILAVLYTYIGRNIIKTSDDVNAALQSTLIGISVSAAISCLSFWGLNILSFIPAFDRLFTVGLPIYSSARVALIIFSTSTLLSLLLLITSLRRNNIGFVIANVVMMGINMLALLLFSLVQGTDQILLFIGILAIFLAVPVFRHKPVNKVFTYITLSSLLLFVSLFLLLKIPQFKDLVVRDSSNVITQVTIDSDATWKITTNAISESLSTAVVGYGLDTFSIAYNKFRPLTQEIVVLNSTNFTHPNNQLLNIFVSTGIIGLIAWVALTFMQARTTLHDVKQRDFTLPEDFMLLALDLVVLFILASSLFIYFTFLIYLLLFATITFSVIVRSARLKETSEMFVLSLGMFIHKANKGMDRTAIMTSLVLILLPFLLLYSYVFRYISGGLNVLEAEKISAEGRMLAEKNKLSEDERADMLSDTASLYGKAVVKSPKNDLLHRRAGLIVSQYVEHLADKYNKTEIDEEKKEIFDDLALYVEVALEESERSTELNPLVYANWSTRANIYSKFVGLGLKSYSKSALSAMQEAVALNPLNFELYYNAAQLYVVNNDNDSALKTLNQVFTINPDHIPSNILAGELSLNDKDYRQADRYFGEAKRIMDKMGNDDSELYKYVVKRLNEIGDQIPKDSDTDTDSNEIDGKQDNGDTGNDSNTGSGNTEDEKKPDGSTDSNPPTGTTTPPDSQDADNTGSN